MKRLYLSALLLLCLTGVGIAQDAPVLSEVQRLKAENFQLTIEVAQLKATLAERENRLLSIDLSLRQTALVDEFRATLKAAPTATFNWSTLTFTAQTAQASK